MFSTYAGFTLLLTRIVGPNDLLLLPKRLGSAGQRGHVKLAKET